MTNDSIDERRYTDVGIDRRILRNGEAVGNCFLNVASHTEVGVEVDSEVSD